MGVGDLDYNFLGVYKICCGIEYSEFVTPKVRRLVNNNHLGLSECDLEKLIESPINLQRLHPILRDCLSKVNRNEDDIQLAFNALNIYYNIISYYCRYNAAGSLMDSMYIENLMRILRYKIKNPKYSISKASSCTDELFKSKEELQSAKKDYLAKFIKDKEKVVRDRLDSIKQNSKKLNTAVSLYGDRLDELLLRDFNTAGLGEDLDSIIIGHFNRLGAINKSIFKIFIDSNKYEKVINTVSMILGAIGSVSGIAGVPTEEFGESKSWINFTVGCCVKQSKLGLNDKASKAIQLIADKPEDEIEIASYFINKYMYIMSKGKKKIPLYLFRSRYIREFFDAAIVEDKWFVKHNGKHIGMDNQNLKNQYVYERAILAAYLTMYNNVNCRIRDVKSNNTLYFLSYAYYALIKSLNCADVRIRNNVGGHRPSIFINRLLDRFGDTWAKGDEYYIAKGSSWNRDQYFWCIVAGGESIKAVLI